MIPEELKRRLAARLSYAFADDTTRKMWNNVVPQESVDSWVSDIDAMLAELAEAGYVILSREELRLAMSTCEAPAVGPTDPRSQPYFQAWRQVQEVLYPEIEPEQIDAEVERDAIRLYRAAVNLYHGRISQEEYDSMVAALFPEGASSVENDLVNGAYATRESDGATE